MDDSSTPGRNDESSKEDVRDGKQDNSQTTAEGISECSNERGNSGDDGEDDTNILRRTLLAGGGLAALGGSGFYLFGDELMGSGGEGMQAFDVWGEARKALRESPDNRLGTAEILVEEGDPKAIFEFVRDDIGTHPPELQSSESVITGVNGGPRGALRAGMGTFREKTDLLANLLERAGYEAEVVQYRRKLAKDRPLELFFGGPDLSFDPGADPSQFENWRNKMGVPDEAVPDISIVDPNGEQSQSLAERIRGALPDDTVQESQRFETRASYAPTSSNGPGVPVVRFRESEGKTTTGTKVGTSTTDAGTSTDESSGEWRYADLFHADESFGSLKKPKRIEQAADPNPATVTVTLEAAQTNTPNKRMKLVSGTWDATELAGRDLIVQTLPGISPFDHPNVRISDISKFVPALGVQDPYADRSELEKLSVVDGAVSVTGDRFTVDDDGDVRKNGEVIAKGDPAGTPEEGGTATETETTTIPDAASEVESLDVSANVGGYPEVRLNVEARDADGNPIQKLPAGVFETTEEGEPVPAEMEANTKRPRVVVYYDTSGSVGLSGFYKEDRREFRKQMRRDIKSVNPDARVEFFEAGSNAWKYMARAATRDANLLIYLSDAHGYYVSDKQKTPERVTAIKEGPPAIMLSTTGKKYETQKEMAKLADGTAIAINDSVKTREAIKKYVADLAPKVPTYSFSYRSPNRGDAGETRTVSVAIPVADVSDETTYTIPEASADPRDQRAFCSLFLRVEVGSHRAERTLAGWDPTIHDRKPNEADRREVLSAFLGGHVLSLESAGITPTVHYDEQLTGKLSLKQLQKARNNADSHEDVKDAVEKGEASLPNHPTRFHAQLPDRMTEDTLTFGTGLRTVLYGQRLVVGTNRFEKFVDLLETGDVRTITKAMYGGTDDRQRAFRLTMERTARLAVLERELFETSTASLLADAELVPATKTSKEWSTATWRRFQAAVRRSGAAPYDIQVVDKSGSTAAFWNVDTKTGEVRGVLPDGSGGGKAARRVKKTIKKVTRLAAYWNLLLGIYTGAAAAMGVASPGVIIGATALGIVASYGILLAKLYGIATVSLATTTTGNIVEEAKRTITVWVCNLAMSLAMSHSGWNPAELADFMNNLHALSKGEYAFGCTGTN